MFTIRIRILKNKQIFLWHGWVVHQAIFTSDALMLFRACTTLAACMLEGEDFPQILHLTLESTANISVAWMGAAAGFQEGSSKNDVERKLQDIQRHKENLCVFLDLGRIGLNNRGGDIGGARGA